MRRARALKPRRAWLFMPGGRMKFIQKAAKLDVDVVCMDLEDGVAEGDAKAEARSTIRTALETLNFGRSDVAVRINTPRLDERIALEDLEAVLTAPVLPQTLCVPKVAHVHELTRVLDSSESILSSRPDWKAGRGGERMALVTMCESPLGLLNLAEILEASTDPNAVLDTQAVIFGGDDYAAEAGATRSTTNEEILMPRQMVVATCRAYGVQPLDIIIHPKQIDPVQSAFSPTEEQIAEAEELLEAYQLHYSASNDDAHSSGDGESKTVRKGAFTYKGKMIDMPTVLIAQNVVARAEAAENSN
eukprot:jgi/Bigna1/79068/fgenesh1_pg.59_\